MHISDSSDVLLKGYLINRVNRIEIEEIELNRRLKSQGKSYSRAIDYYEETYFIHDDSLGSNNLFSILNRNAIYFHNNVFIMPSKDTKEYIEKYCEKKVKLDTSDYFYPNKTYYQLNNNDKHLFNITYIEGNAYKTEVENTRYNKMFLNIVYNIDNSHKTFDCYFIYNNKTVHKCVAEEGIVEWNNIE